eukprot:Trichotokara_eunicae@DN5599_c0_g1_i5.p1
MLFLQKLEETAGTTWQTYLRTLWVLESILSQRNQRAFAEDLQSYLSQNGADEAIESLIAKDSRLRVKGNSLLIILRQQQQRKKNVGGTAPSSRRTGKSLLDLESDEEEDVAESESADDGSSSASDAVPPKYHVAHNGVQVPKATDNTGPSLLDLGDDDEKNVAYRGASTTASQGKVQSPPTGGLFEGMNLASSSGVNHSKGARPGNGGVEIRKDEFWSKKKTKNEKKKDDFGSLVDL